MLNSIYNISFQYNLSKRDCFHVETEIDKDTGIKITKKREEEGQGEEQR
jgi:hypothetical protein